MPYRKGLRAARRAWMHENAGVRIPPDADLLRWWNAQPGSRSTPRRLLTRRPAESGGLAAGLVVLIGRLIGVEDPDLLAALAVLVGAIPAGITALVAAGGISGVLRRLWRGSAGLTLLELLVALLIVAVFLMLIGVLR